MTESAVPAEWNNTTVVVHDMSADINTPRRKRVLFFAEAVTLAHVARPIVLAASLDPRCHEVTIACHPRYHSFLHAQSWNILALHSISSKQFLRALALGTPLYNIKTLHAYVKEDMQLIASVKPDLVVGDFRLSLAVSCRLLGVPYASITNAYWSPYCATHTLPLPVLPITRVLPLPIAQAIFRLAQPLALRAHSRPFNQLRQAHGMQSLGADLRHLYTDADYTLYADVPSLFSMTALPAQHRFIGPVLWSPPIQLPAWWGQVTNEKPIVYVTLGSSGSSRLLWKVVHALAEQPVTLLVSTAGATAPRDLPRNVYAANYLPGMEAAQRAQLVICNGGSPTSHQALAAGVPVLGIVSNMDQFLNMLRIVTAGAGLLLRADRVNDCVVVNQVNALLTQTQFSLCAQQLRREFATANAATAFLNFVTQL